MMMLHHSVDQLAQLPLGTHNFLDFIQRCKFMINDFKSFCLSEEETSSVHLVVARVAAEPAIVRVVAQTRTGYLVAITEFISTVWRKVERKKD